MFNKSVIKLFKSIKFKHNPNVDLEYEEESIVEEMLSYVDVIDIPETLNTTLEYYLKIVGGQHIDLYLTTFYVNDNNTKSMLLELEKYLINTKYVGMIYVGMISELYNKFRFLV